MEEQIKKKKNTKKRRKLKKKLASMTAMVLVLMLGILGTMAYLSTVSNKKTNTFTGSKGISLGLTEPGWDKDNDDGTTVKVDGKDVVITPKPGDGGYYAANYTPGKVIVKDPILTNTTAGTQDANAQEWVAMAITYQLNSTDVSYATLTKVIEDISFNTSEETTGGGKWVLLKPILQENGSDKYDSNGNPVLDTSKGYAIFMYSKPLKSVTELNANKAADADDYETGESTRPLFSKIQIRSSIADGNDQNYPKGLEAGLVDLNANTGNIFASAPNPAFTVNGNLPDFKINVIGAAVKNEYYTWDEHLTLNSDGTTYTAGYTTTLVDDLEDVTGTNDYICFHTDDKKALQDSLLEVLHNELTSNTTLGYVTKS